MSVSCKNEKKNDTLNSKTESEFNPDFYSEVGACPFEGCLYGEWTTNWGNQNIQRTEFRK